MKTYLEKNLAAIYQVIIHNLYVGKITYPITKGYIDILLLNEAKFLEEAKLLLHHLKFSAVLSSNAKLIESLNFHYQLNDSEGLDIRVFLEIYQCSQNLYYLDIRY